MVIRTGGLSNGCLPRNLASDKVLGRIKHGTQISGARGTRGAVGACLYCFLGSAVRSEDSGSGEATKLRWSRWFREWPPLTKTL